MSRESLTPIAAQTANESVGGLLQRKCDCGNKASTLNGECEECQQKKALGLQTKLEIGDSNDPLEHEADRVAAHVLGISMPSPGPLSQPAAPLISRRTTQSANGRSGAAPKAVRETLQTSGSPLGTRVRSFFEPRFGYDFSQVRIHDDVRSAESARAVGAHAYTVGNHVVFNRGRYSPDSASGQLLLAHELAHVVQQGKVLRRHGMVAEPEARNNRGQPEAPLLRPDTEDEVSPEEQPVAGFDGLLQRQVGDDILGLGENDDFPAGGWAEKDEAAAISAEVEAERECIAQTPADPIECDPAQALSWADFTGAAPSQARFGAVTFSGLRERSMNTALLRCMPNSAAAQANPPTRGVQAFFDPAQSGVRARYVNATDPAVNGCNQTISNCQDFFDDQASQGLTGAEWWMSPGTGCAASPTPRGDRAASRAQCASVVGRDCNDQAVAESARLLNHEQGHFDLSCAMARKANAMLSPTIDFTALLRGARRTLSQQQMLYDNETDHGCVAAQQTSWETAIAGGLPGVNIPVRSRQRRRGRRGGRRR